MKAKVIKTGEIVEVDDYNDSIVTVYRDIATEFFAQNEYRRDEIEFLPDTYEEVTIEGYVARDKNNDLSLYQTYPERQYKYGYWRDGYDEIELPEESFPKVTWASEPKRVKITITPME